MPWPSLPGSRSLLVRAVRGTEWAKLLDYVSPSFFEVVPLSGLLAQGREMAGNAAGGDFATVREEVRGVLDARGVAVRLRGPDQASDDAGPDVAEGTLDETTALRVGQGALETYFAQLFGAEVAIVDLRASRWTAGAGRSGEAPPVWTPRPMYVRWDPVFLEGVRELYRGFYRDDDAAFRQAAEQLGLGEAADVLKKHFGQGDPTAVRFRMEVFHCTFHEAFVRCRDAGATLHRNFLALGLYLACLYDLLETLDRPFDVRAAFERGAREQ